MLKIGILNVQRCKKGDYEDEEYEKTTDKKPTFIKLINLQGGFYPRYAKDIISHTTNKINVYLANKLSWGVYETTSVYIALFSLKEGGLMIMKIDPVFTLYKMKLLYMISLCFETFYLEKIKKEVFIVCGGCKPFEKRTGLIYQLENVLRTENFILDTTIPEETFAILQFFACAVHT